MTRRMLPVILGIAAMTSCSPQGGLKSRKVSLIVKSLSDPFYVDLAQGAHAASAEANLDLVILGIEKQTYVERQMALVGNEIIKRVGVIVISPADSKALVGVLKRAQEKGIRVIAVDTPLAKGLMKEQGVSIPYVGPDHRAVGKKAGEYLARRLGAKGKVAVLTGVAGVLSGDLRVQGFIEACSDAPGMQVVAQPCGNWRRKDAADSVAAILKEHPDLKGIFTVNRAMTLGILDGLGTAGKGKEVVVVGCGRDREIDEALTAGRLAATIDLHPKELGRGAIGLARKLLAGDSIPNETFTAWDLIEAGGPAK